MIKKFDFTEQALANGIEDCYSSIRYLEYGLKAGQFKRLQTCSY